MSRALCWVQLTTSRSTARRLQFSSCKALSNDPARGTCKVEIQNVPIADATMKTDEIGLNLFRFFCEKRAAENGWGRRSGSVMKKSIHVPHIILDAIKTESFSFIHPAWIAGARILQFANNNSEKPNKFGRKQNPILCYTILRWPNTLSFCFHPVRR